MRHAAVEQEGGASTSSRDDRAWVTTLAGHVAKGATPEGCCPADVRDVGTNDPIFAMARALHVDLRLGCEREPAHRFEPVTSAPDRSGSSQRVTRLKADHSADHNNPRQAVLFSDSQEPARPGKPRYAQPARILQASGQH